MIIKEFIEFVLFYFIFSYVHCTAKKHWPGEKDKIESTKKLYERNPSNFEELYKMPAMRAMVKGMEESLAFAEKESKMSK